MDSHQDVPVDPPAVEKTEKEPIEYPWESEPAWKCNSPRQYPLPSDGKSWDRCREIIDEFDGGMCGAWKDEIQSLLIFAGLFSAIVTAFGVEASKELQEAPYQVTNQLLARISSQLANSTDVPLPSIAPFAPSASTIRTNMLWTTSLTLSLTTVAVGILCLQWIREYQRHDPGQVHLHPAKAINVRQIRYKSFTKWKVPFIISILPALLQLAVVLFLIGLVDYFHAMNPRVGVVLAVFVGLTLGIIVVTTILPAVYDLVTFISADDWGHDRYLRPACAYRSPQAWGVVRLSHMAIKVWIKAHSIIGRTSIYWSIDTLSNARTWSNIDDQCLPCNNPGLVWIARTFAEKNPAIAKTVYQCIHDTDHYQSLWATTRLLRSWWIPHRDRLSTILYSSEGRYVSLVKDLSLFEASQSIFQSDTPIDEALHLHRLELYVRLKSTWHENLIYDSVALWAPRVSMECPDIFNYVNFRREKIPSIPEPLRIQLFKCMKKRLEEEEFSFAPAHEMLAILATLILDPLTPVPRSTPPGTSIPTPDITQAMLDTGFSILLLAAKKVPATPSITTATQVAPEDDQFERLCKAFGAKCLQPWMTRFNEDIFFANKHYLDSSTPFWEFVDQLSTEIDNNNWVYLGFRYEEYSEAKRLWKRFRGFFPGRVLVQASE